MSEASGSSTDAVAQYERLARIADPQDLEQINAEALEKLPADRRDEVGAALAQAKSVREFGVDPGLLNVFVAYAIGSELGLAYLAAEPLGADGAQFGGGFDNPDGFDIV